MTLTASPKNNNFKIHKMIMVAKRKLCYFVCHPYLPSCVSGYTIITYFMEMGTPLLHALWKWVHHYYMLYEKEVKEKEEWPFL